MLVPSCGMQSIHIASKAPLARASIMYHICTIKQCSRSLTLISAILMEIISPNAAIAKPCEMQGEYLINNINETDGLEICSTDWVNRTILMGFYWRTILRKALLGN